MPSQFKETESIFGFLPLVKQLKGSTDEQLKTRTTNDQMTK
jgi:hypothetical protein